MHGPGGPETHTYQATVASAYGEDLMVSATELELVRNPGAWTIRTLRTTGSWVTGGVEGSYDSDAPLASDPWPLTLHHAIVQEPVRMTVINERPSMVMDPQDWVSRARSRAYQTSLPAAALQSAEQLLVPQNQVLDLVRFFPGRPETTWVRIQRLGGVEVEVAQQCTQDGRVWTCEGLLRAVDPAGPQILDGVYQSEMELDLQGMIRLDERYEGTLVVAGPDGEGAVDRPMGGRRKVVRL